MQSMSQMVRASLNSSPSRLKSFENWKEITQYYILLFQFQFFSDLQQASEVAMHKAAYLNNYICKKLYMRPNS